MWGLLVAAAVPLFVATGDRLAWSARGWMLALVGWAAVWVPARFFPDTSVLAPEAGLTLAALGLALVLGIAVSVLVDGIRTFRFGWRQPAAILGGVRARSCPCSAFTADVFDGRWDAPDSGWANGWRSPRPRPSKGEFRMLWVGDPAVLPLDPVVLRDGTGYTLTRNGPGDVTEQWRAPEHDADQVVDRAIVLATDGRTNRLGRMLAPMGVRFVVVPSTQGTGGGANAARARGAAPGDGAAARPGAAALEPGSRALREPRVRPDPGRGGRPPSRPGRLAPTQPGGAGDRSHGCGAAPVAARSPPAPRSGVRRTTRSGRRLAAATRSVTQERSAGPTGTRRRRGAGRHRLRSAVAALGDARRRLVHLVPRDLVVATHPGAPGSVDPGDRARARRERSTPPRPARRARRRGVLVGAGMSVDEPTPEAAPAAPTARRAPSRPSRPDPVRRGGGARRRGRGAAERVLGSDRVDGGGRGRRGRRGPGGRLASSTGTAPTARRHPTAVPTRRCSWRAWPAPTSRSPITVMPGGDAAPAHRPHASRAGRTGRRTGGRRARHARAGGRRRGGRRTGRGVAPPGARRRRRGRAVHADRRARLVLRHGHHRRRERSTTSCSSIRSATTPSSTSRSSPTPACRSPTGCRRSSCRGGRASRSRCRTSCCARRVVAAHIHARTGRVVAERTQIFDGRRRRRRPTRRASRCRSARPRPPPTWWIAGGSTRDGGRRDAVRSPTSPTATAGRSETSWSGGERRARADGRRAVARPEPGRRRPLGCRSTAHTRSRRRAVDVEGHAGPGGGRDVRVVGAVVVEHRRRQHARLDAHRHPVGHPRARRRRGDDVTVVNPGPEPVTAELLAADLVDRRVGPPASPSLRSHQSRQDRAAGPARRPTGADRGHRQHPVVVGLTCSATPAPRSSAAIPDLAHGG